MNVYNVTDYCGSVTLSLSGQTLRVPNGMHEIRLNVELALHPGKKVILFAVSVTKVKCI